MKRRSFQKQVAIGLGAVFLLSFAISYVFFNGALLNLGGSESAAKKLEERKPQIKEDTRIKKIIVFECEDRVVTTVPTTTKFIGMDYEALEKEFPPVEGWEIDDSVPNELIVTRQEDKICPYHREFRHLGIDQGYLAVYEGPLGYNRKVLHREKILISSLPPDIQEELQLSMEYLDQPPDVQAKLKNHMEFEDETRLNTVMENFDEYLEE